MVRVFALPIPDSRSLPTPRRAHSLDHRRRQRQEEENQYLRSDVASTAPRIGHASLHVALKWQPSDGAVDRFGFEASATLPPPPPAAPSPGPGTRSPSPQSRAGGRRVRGVPRPESAWTLSAQDGSEGGGESDGEDEQPRRAALFATPLIRHVPPFSPHIQRVVGSTG